jgi:hypothetical protein
MHTHLLIIISEMATKRFTRCSTVLDGAPVSVTILVNIARSLTPSSPSLPPPPERPDSAWAMAAAAALDATPGPAAQACTSRSAAPPHPLGGGNEPCDNVVLPIHATELSYSTLTCKEYTNSDMC